MNTTKRFTSRAQILIALADGYGIGNDCDDKVIVLGDGGLQHVSGDYFYGLVLELPPASYYRVEIANPHPKGTLMWAYFEACRGHEVTCNSTDWFFDCREDFEVPGRITFQSSMATDWHTIEDRADEF